MTRFGAAVVMAVGLAAAADGVNPPPGDLAPFQGYWKPLSAEREGKPQMPAEEMQKITVVYDKAEQHLYYADRSTNPPKVLRLALTTVTVNDTASPKTIEFTFAEGPQKGKKVHGIYEISKNGAELKLCYGPADKPRPAGFVAPPGSGYFLETWAKQPTPVQAAGN